MLNSEQKLSKRQIVSSWRLFYVSDPETDGCSHSQAIRAALYGGAQVIIYRDKEATFEKQMDDIKSLMPLVREYNARLFVCDNPYLATATDADGVILGPNDIPSAVAYDVLGENGFVGLSVHHSGESAASLLMPCDFLIMGPFGESFDNHDVPPTHDLAWTTLASRVPVFTYAPCMDDSIITSSIEQRACGVVYINYVPSDAIEMSVKQALDTVLLRRGESQKEKVPSDTNDGSDK